MMTNSGKFKSGIFTIVIMLLCSSFAWAQVQLSNPGTISETGTSVTPEATSVSRAADALRNFKSDPSDPQMSHARYELLKAEADLESAIANEKMTDQQMEVLKMNVGNRQAHVAKLESVQPKQQQASSLKNGETELRNRISSLKNILDSPKAQQMSEKEITALKQNIKALEQKLSSAEVQNQNNSSK